MDKTRPKSAGEKSQPATRGRSKKSATKETKQPSEPRSRSKVNRILNNIERSIMRPFAASSNSDNSKHGKEETSSSSKLSSTNGASRANEIRDNNNSCDKPNLKSKKTNKHSDSENKSSLNEQTLTGGVCKGHARAPKDQVASTTTPYQDYNRHTSVISDNLQMSNSRNSVGVSEHISAKLDTHSALNTTSSSIQAKTTPTLAHQTFNKFHQQLVSTLRHNNTQNHLATKPLSTNSHKLSIPPPHANEEARSHNQALLFGRSVVEAVTSLSVSHQPNKSSAINSNASHSESSPKKSSATSRLVGTDAARPTSATITEARDDSQRISSPARSSIVTRLGSQLNGNLRKNSLSSKETNSNLLNRTEDEESGFSSYQSRRQPLNLRSSNGQITSADVPQDPAIEQISLSTATNTTASNMIPTPQSYWQSQNSAKSYPQNQPHLYQNQLQQRNAYSQHYAQQQSPMIHSQIFQNSQSIIPINQMPMLSPILRKNLENQLYDPPTQQQQQARVNYLKQMQAQQHQPPMSMEQPIYGLHSAPPQVKPYTLLGGSDNQQIYANAPPKPRRYQFYNNILESASYPMQVTRATNLSGTIPTIRTNSGVQQQNSPMRPYEHVATGVNQPHMTDIPVSFHQNLMDDMNYTSHMSQNSSYTLRHNQQLQRQQQQEQLNFVQINKSKSSLESGDLAKFRQNRQLRIIPSARPQAWHPTFGPMVGEINPLSGPAHHTHDVASVSGLSNQWLDGSRLQRSKSVTHLLPDIEMQINLDGRAKDMWNDSRRVVNNLKHLNTSVASTTNLNNVANTIYNSNYNVQYVLDSNANNLNRALSSYNLDQPRLSYDPTNGAQLQQKYNQTYSERLFPNATLRRATTSDWYIRQQPHVVQQHELDSTITMPTARNDDKAMPSSSSSSSNNSSGMFVRQQLQAQKSNTQSSTDNSKPSLDDKIRHLVIVNNNRENDASTAARLINSHVGISQSTKINDHQVYKQSNNASRPVSMSRTHNTATNNWQQNVPLSTIIQRSQTDTRLDFPETKQATPEFSSSRNPFFGTIDNSATSHSNDSSSSDMGNRNNRYQINVPATGGDVSDGAFSAPDVANSQLIVDLTTPRVLAKTQTTLSSNQLNMIGTSTHSGKENQSLNQVGLPHSSKLPLNKVDDRTFSANQNIRSELLKPDQTKSVNFLERTAPYYYSDLKSEEQRQALFNIVQQKSLSPPPQLLSRSADQSSTRLGPKSATLHSKQARLLSKNLLIRQQDPAAMQQDLSSTASITKNIDRLFDATPVDRCVDDNIARSMLTLNECDETPTKRSIGLVQLPSQRSNLHVDTSTGRRLIKSKSLDNIGQTTYISTSSGRIPNPIYENIRLSNKLMNAINCAPDPLSAPTSGESMDSILGSSLEDSDSNSDIIDDIKLSPTDNHIHDISRLIEQLKINHSKLTEEYRTTLLRIAKTINSKNKQQSNDGSVNNEKLARKLDLLKQRSKKCESRSKNQLALIQMMENVLRQSKLRSENVNRHTPSKAWPNDSTPRRTNSHQRCSSDIKDDTKSAVQNRNSNQSPEAESKQSIRNNLTFELTKPSSDRSNGTQSQVDSVDKRNEKDEVGILTGRRSDDEEKENYKIGSFDGRVVKKLSACSVAEKIQDIEKRNREQVIGNSATDETHVVPANRTSSKSSNPCTNNCVSPTSNSASSNTNNSLNSIANGFESLRDDDDFIEFYSSDVSGHRSNFEASQFSASDYNTSTSASESSTSGLCTDSLGSAKNSYKSQLADPKAARFENLNFDSSDSKPRSHTSLNNVQPDKNLLTSSSSNGRHSADIDSIRSGKFTNVLGNVIDVDVCPGNNLSQCSPMH